MSPIKRTRHAVYDLKYHFVWAPKYRKKILRGDVAEYVGQVFQRIAEEYEWEIDEMAVEPDHVPLFIHSPPRFAPAQVVQIMKSISARETFEQFPHLRKQLWAGEQGTSCAAWATKSQPRRSGITFAIKIRSMMPDNFLFGTNAPQLAAGFLY